MGDYNADPAPQLNKARQVAFNFFLVPEADLKFDQFSTASGLKVYHFVKKIGSTNLSILVDPDQIPIF